MDERPRIYITCLHLSYGGVEMVISSLANAFADRGYPVEILCTYRFGDPFYRLDDRVTVTYLTKLLPNKKEFWEAVKEKRINRIFLEGVRSIYILFCKKLSMIRKISSIHEGVIISTRHEHTKILSRYGNRNVLKIAQLHNDHNFNKKLIREIRRRYKNIEYFTLLTKQAQTEMESILDGYNHYTKCVYIPNFISSETRAVPRGTKRKKQVVAVGRLHPIKGFDRLLQIWKLAVKNHPDWRLKIIGDGDRMVPLLKLADELGIRDCVDFAGSVPHDRVIEEMSASGIYAMSSLSEAFPLVLLEAMLCSLPIVAFDVRIGIRALVENNQNGFLIEDGDLPQFARKLDLLMSDDSLRIEMGEKATGVLSNYSEENVMNQWDRILRSRRWI